MTSLDLLDAVSTIRTGYTFRNKIDGAATTGNIPVIQPRDIEGGTLSNIDSIASVPVDQISALSNHLLKIGDLLIANKGLRFATFLYKGEPKNCVAASSFFVIRVQEQKLHPVILQWYLNQPPAKEYLSNNSASTTIPSLTKSVLSKLIIPVPPINVQLRMTELLLALEQEKQLLKNLLQKREEFGNSYLWELLSITNPDEHEKERRANTFKMQ